MENNLIFREIRSGDEESACKLVLNCFNQFIAPGYSLEGIKEFNNYVTADFLKERLRNGNYSFIVLHNDELIGVIEVRNLNHISLLFVKREYHKMGIAKKLIELSVSKSRKINSSINIMEVNSSPYAVNIYEKMGFVSTDVEQVVNGIKFVPMNLKLT